MVGTALVVGTPNPIVVVVVVVDDDGAANAGAADAVVAMENGVVVIGCARRLESALVPDEVVVVVTGRKLVEDGNVDGAVVLPARVGNERRLHLLLELLCLLLMELKTKTQELLWQ